MSYPVGIDLKSFEIIWNLMKYFANPGNGKSIWNYLKSVWNIWNLFEINEIYLKSVWNIWNLFEINEIYLKSIWNNEIYLKSFEI